MSNTDSHSDQVIDEMNEDVDIKVAANEYAMLINIPITNTFESKLSVLCSTEAFLSGVHWYKEYLKKKG